MTDTNRTQITGRVDGSLRDRIAAVLSQHDVNLPDKVADALIAALNLAEACGSGCVWQIPRRYEDMTPYQQGLLRKGRR